MSLTSFVTDAHTTTEPLNYDAHADIKNSLRQTTQNQSTSATKHFDAFGNETSSTGTWQGPFQYGGQFGYQTDTDSRLKLLGHRSYDSGTGRFVSKDRANSGLNWYTHCGNDPVSFADPFGLWRSSVCGILGGIAGFIIGGPLGAAALGGLGAALGDAADQAADNPDGSIDWSRAATVGAVSAMLDLVGGKVFALIGRAFIKVRITQVVQGAWNAALRDVGAGAGSAFGTRVHSHLRSKLRILNIKGIEPEPSFLNGTAVRYGRTGSKRPDVVYTPDWRFGRGKFVFDGKTGDAVLTEARKLEFIHHVPRLDPRDIIQIK